MKKETDDWNGDEDEYDDEVDEEDDDVNAVATCPACGAEVYEDAERCPVCGDYIVFSTNPWYGQPWWWILLGIIGSAALILALVLL